MTLQLAMRVVLRVLGAIVGTSMVLLSPLILLDEMDNHGIWGALEIAATGGILAYYGFTGKSPHDQSVSDALAGRTRRPWWDE
jgi:hypothetical protein